MEEYFSQWTRVKVKSNPERMYIVKDQNLQMFPYGWKAECMIL